MRCINKPRFLHTKWNQILQTMKDLSRLKQIFTLNKKPLHDFMQPTEPNRLVGTVVLSKTKSCNEERNFVLSFKV